MMKGKFGLSSISEPPILDSKEAGIMSDIRLTCDQYPLSDNRISEKSSYARTGMSLSMSMTIFMQHGHMHRHRHGHGHVHGHEQGNVRVNVHIRVHV
jgi:hypothetical protein